MSLLAGNLQELLLHVDESIHAAPKRIGNSMRSRLVPDAFFHTAHKNLGLFLRQIKKYLLAFNEVSHAFPSYFAQIGGRGVMSSGGLVLYRCWHITPPFCCIAASSKLYWIHAIMSSCIAYLVQRNIGHTPGELPPFRTHAKR